MKTNLEKYKEDLKKLINEGEQLLNAMYAEIIPEQFREALAKNLKTKKEVERFIRDLPSFELGYQTWYSESLSLLKQLLPDRLNDFIDLYKKPKSKRKDITYDNYVIEDALIGLRVTRGFTKEKVVGADAAIPKFKQQLGIIRSVSKRFDSSLFDIQQLVQADLFDFELDSARELNKKGFARGAGAIAGVIMERHLDQVLSNHNIPRKKRSTIGDLAQLLKDEDIIDIADWRRILYLTDIRNLCDHSKKKEPTKEQIDELILGTEKVVKTLF